MRILSILTFLLLITSTYAQKDTSSIMNWKVYNPGTTPSTKEIPSTTLETSIYISDSALAAHNSTGETLIYKDARIDSVSYFLATKNNPETATMEGYRVQIFITQNKNEANKMIEEFRKEYETIPVYRIWIQPNHPVRAGDCRSKLDAQKLLKGLKYKFPGAYIVRDEIQLPSINPYSIPTAVSK